MILNLIRNAIEAMMERPRRELLISTHTGGEAGMAQVRVTDTGPGLAPEVSARMFQPFVTTKEKGMGVGLSICRTIRRVTRGAHLGPSGPVWRHDVRLHPRAG